MPSQTDTKSTEDAIRAILEELGFKRVTGDLCSGCPRMGYGATDQTVSKVQKFAKDGKWVVLDTDGSFTIK